MRMITIAHRMIFKVYRMTLNLSRIFHVISNREIERFLSNRQRRRRRQTTTTTLPGSKSKSITESTMQDYRITKLSETLDDDFRGVALFLGRFSDNRRSKRTTIERARARSSRLEELRNDSTRNNDNFTLNGAIESKDRRIDSISEKSLEKQIR